MTPLASNRLLVLLAAAWCLAAASSGAQSPAPPASPDQSAAELSRLVSGLTITPRVLLIGMHPDDENTQLITWLSRARHIESAYLSITRGEGGVNFGGSESGTSLGAIRTQEVLAARRIDGAKQFFTRAYDFGPARTVQDVMKYWARDSIVGDIVAVIRSFRPQVVIAMLPDSAIAGDGQHQALELFVVQGVLAARDSNRFRAFGDPWLVSKIYRPGHGIAIETSGYDRALGKTYAELALQSRAQHRSQGLDHLTDPKPPIVELRRMGIRIVDSGVGDQALFDGVDTSFMRLAAGASPEIATMIPAIEAYADSARRALDPINPSAAIPYLAQVAKLASRARGAALWCRHPSAGATPSASPARCDARTLDLDASIDLVRERSVAALLAATGISFEAISDRELVAGDDTALVKFTMSNHGRTPATLADLSVWGSVETALEPVTVPPDSAAHSLIHVTGLASPNPWWIGPRGGPERGGDRFGAVPSAVDGLTRNGLVPLPLAILGVAVPENIRRTSDVTVTVTVAGVTVTTSIGPIVFRHADASVGLQNRPVTGIPNVTLQFARALEWIPSNKPLKRSLRVAVKSHSDREQEFALKILTPSGMPKGIRVDSLPKSLRLAPREERELFIQLRGRMEDTSRKPIALVGVRLTKVPAVRDSSSGPRQPHDFKEVESLDADHQFPQYQTGFLAVQRDYLPPIHVMPTPGEWIQPIDITIPRALTTLYLPGGADDLATALRQAGAWVTEIESADQLLTVDLSRVSSILVGARAFDIHPELLGQVGRLTQFVRDGGTLVVLRGDEHTISSRLFPYPIAFGPAGPERVMESDAPLSVVAPSSRLLKWPNRIRDGDWSNWVVGRADLVPAVAEAHYGKIIEVHDTGQPENGNAILTARLGKGTFIYTTLTLDQQIAGGVPGALRLLVNLLSANLTP